MTLPSNNHSYKVISLLIKTAIFILSIWYIIQKLTSTDIVWNISDLISQTKSLYFLSAVFLVALNWGIEAFKWKYLIQKMELISLSTAIKSILSGVTISIFTPNRVGEFAGRVFYLKNPDKVKATLISLFGSFLQLSVTLLAGIVACIIYYYQHKNEPSLINFISINNLLLVFITLTILVPLMIFVYFTRNFISNKIRETLFLFDSKELLNTFFLSLLRYIIFSFQYYLILQAFGIDAGLINSFILIALTFFVSAVIPTYALTEIAVRGASSVYFFSTVTNDTTSIVTASIVLWIINLALPALVGGVFMWNLKFFKD